MRGGSDAALLWFTVGLLIVVGMIVASCTPTVVADAGCATYGAQRAQMPRPLGEGPLASWVAVTDSAMTGACR